MFSFVVVATHKSVPFSLRWQMKGRCARPVRGQLRHENLGSITLK